MIRDLELIKADVDLIAMIVRLRGASVLVDGKADDVGEGDDAERSV